MTHQRSLAARLRLILVLPLASLAIVLSAKTIEDFSVYGNMRKIGTLSQVCVDSSDLVHELQRERGLVGGLLGNSGDEFVARLPNQRERTDDRRADLMATLARVNLADYDQDLADTFEAWLRRIEQLDGLRQRVDARTVPAAEAFDFFTTTNGMVIDSIARVAHLVEDADVGLELSAYVSLLLGKERSGAERALMTNMFSRDTFAEGAYQRFLALVSQQQSYAHAFRLFASDAGIAALDEVMQQPVLKDTEEMRSIARSKGEHGSLGVDAVVWYDKQTEKIDLLKGVEDLLADQLRATAASKRSYAFWSLVLYLVIGVGLSVFSVWISQRMSNNLTSGIHESINQLAAASRSLGRASVKVTASAQS
ncbi:MAG: nitrate- and nitrite sensing domain-containing protein, partial [Planctomycetota bacterium]|nr:nitrate- and nitrite sensing domain-containing protein [Planctomycetota bacterium]